MLVILRSSPPQVHGCAAIAALLLATAVEAAARPTKPNLVVFLQDDQDFVMGGWKPLKQARALIADQGIFAENWFIHTPVCCPSRAELLSGRYFHNLRMPTHVGGCMHVQTGIAGQDDRPNDHSFAKYLVETRGYVAAWFGKHLNHCPHTPPLGYGCPGCRWFANGGGADSEPGGYTNATFSDFTGAAPTAGNPLSRNGTYRASSAGEYAGYTTSIIANKSIAWLRAAPRGGSAPPFVLTVASKGPHYPATPAPWYTDGTYVDAVSAPRTAGFGVDPAALQGHHAMIASQGPLLPNEARAVDYQFRKRWKALKRGR